MSLDVLLIAPQPEEAYACDLLFPKKLTDGGAKAPGVTRHVLEGLSVGRFLINAMGSLNAALRCQPIIQQYAPKVVLLVGIAAGREPGFPLGHVCYNRQIYYCSFGKVLGSNVQPEIRALDPVRENLRMLDCAGLVDRAQWVADARSWFSRHRKTWQKRHPDFPVQRWLNEEPTARPASIGSGELVIASDEYVAHLRSSNRVADLTVFEMEAYAIGKLCEYAGCHFMTIRGISDSGGASKDTSAEKDTYRLMATLTAAAFTKRMMEHDSFKTLIFDSTPPRSRSVSCLHPHVASACVDDRRCVDVGFRPTPAQDAHLTRVYEQVPAMNFSRDFAKHIDGGDTSQAMTFFFPYSPTELLAFFERQGPAVREFLEPFHEWKECLEKGHEPSTALRAGAAMADTKLRQYARRKFPHFQACATRCKKWKENPKKTKKSDRLTLPRYMSRIIVLSDELAIVERVLSDPLRSLYSAVLDVDVPTYIVSRGNLEEMKLPVDDVTFFEEPSTTQGEKRLTALRFFEGSKLLIVTGWPCHNSGLARPSSEWLHLGALYSRWRDELGTGILGTGDSIFSELPLEKCTLSPTKVSS